MTDSKLPTLLQKGFIVPTAKMIKKDKDLLKNKISIDYILEFISDRILDKSGNIKKKPKCIGDKVIILKSGTGTGKSTVLPPYIYKLFNDRVKRNIAITQPRVLTAIDIPTNLPEYYPYLTIGKNLGYNTGSYKRIPSDNGIIFMTTGILLQQLNILTDDEFINKYSFILIDEVHDRNIDIDLTLFLLKKFLSNNYDNPKCPIIILMSATFEPKLFINYFNCPSKNYISITGSTYLIEDNYIKYDAVDYIKKAIDIAEELHIKNIDDIDDNSLFRDIIIFVSGMGPSKKIIEALHKFNSNILTKSFDEINKYIDNKPKEDRIHGGGYKNYFIAPIELSSGSFGLAGKEYQNLFSEINNITVPIYNLTSKGNIDINSVKMEVIPTRRIIISTPVAETGVTIDTLKYCIDTGMVTSVEFNPDYGNNLLLKKPVTQGMATQRRGRVGRKSPGFWYPCYTKESYDRLQTDQFAEILSTDITLALLNILIIENDTVIETNKNLKINKELIDNKNLFNINNITDDNYYFLQHDKKLNTSDIDFIENPSSQSLSYSYEKLYGLGFINSNYQPTIIGFYGNKLRKISIENIKLIFAGYAYGANVLDLITIISFLSVRSTDICEKKYVPINPFSKISDDKYEFYNKIVIGDSFINLLFIWYTFSSKIDKIIQNKSISKNKLLKNKLLLELYLTDWCIENKIKYTGLLKVISFRDDVIESFLAIGLNPYYNGLNIDRSEYNLLELFKNNLNDGIAEIIKIKKCIYEGYKFNLCVWNNKYKKYFLYHRNIPIFIKSNVISRMGDDAIQTNPNFIILSDIIFKTSFMDHNLYEFTSNGYISVMDTYIDVDLNFLSS